MSRAVPLINYDGFPGIDNVHRTTELHERKKVAELSNIDLDDKNRATRRNGYDFKVAGSWHSLWASRDGKRVFAVVNNDLCLVNELTLATTVILANVAPGRPFKYVEVLDKVYYTNGAVIGYFQNGEHHDIPAPTDPFKRALLPGHDIEYYNGSVLVARGNTVMISDSMQHNQVDMRHGFRQFGGHITLLRAVKGGVFIADGNTHFVAGHNLFEVAPGMKTVIAPYDAIPGTAVAVDGGVIAEGKTYPGKVVFWASHKGICLGTDGGEFQNLTEQEYEMPATVRGGASLYRKTTDGISQVVMSITE